MRYVMLILIALMNALIMCGVSAQFNIFGSEMDLLLVMLLHAFSDSTFRIVKGLFGYVHEAPICVAVDKARSVIDYVVLPVMAVLICVFYDKLKGRTKAEVRYEK